jgi:hypothetical protein
MSVTQRDVLDVLTEYVEHYHSMSHDVAYHLVRAAEACATEVAIRDDLFPKDASLQFPEIMTLARFYSHIDPLRKTIFADKEWEQSYDETKFRYFYRWLDDKAESDEYGNGRKIALRDALVGTDAYIRAFPRAAVSVKADKELYSRNPVTTNDDDDYVDEDRSIHDYADEYVRNA